MTLRTATAALPRDVNRSAIVGAIISRGPIARAEIARRLGLSPATVTAVTRELLEEGLIRVAERAPSRRGRPALLLELVGGAGAALGGKIAPDRLVGVRVNLEAEEVERYEVPFDASAPDAVEVLADVLAEWADDIAGRPPLLGVGLGAPGVFDVRTGRLHSPLLGWDELELASILEERLALPVFIDNDVNTLAVAERLFGRGHDVAHFVTVTIGRGVGLGIVADGDIYRGFRGGAGEFGHTTVVADGPRCTCGKRGCLEAVVADPALLASARRARLLKVDDGIDRLRGLADAGNERARRIYADAGATLGRAVGDLVNILGPELVLVSGEGTQAWTHLRAAFERAFRASVFPPLGDIAVEVDPWDDAKWAIGAATLVLRARLTTPLDGNARHALRARADAERRMGVVA